MASGTRRPAADLVLVQADQATRELVELLVDGIPVLAAGALRPALQVTRQAFTPEQVALVAGHIRAGFHPPPTSEQRGRHDDARSTEHSFRFAPRAAAPRRAAFLSMS
jgi:hypothetical protein